MPQDTIISTSYKYHTRNCDKKNKKRKIKRINYINNINKSTELTNIDIYSASEYRNKWRKLRGRGP